LRVFFSF